MRPGSGVHRRPLGAVGEVESRARAGAWDQGREAAPSRRVMLGWARSGPCRWGGVKSRVWM